MAPSFFEPAREAGHMKKTVLVTRAAQQAGDLVARLQQFGFNVIELPLIEIVDPLDGGEALGVAMAKASSADSPYGWIVLTSPNGAHRALTLLSVDATDTKIAAIGPGTAAVCVQLGFRVSLLPDRSVGEGLLEAFPDPNEHQRTTQRRVLLPQAESARTIVSEGLRAKGWQVDVVTAYRTVERTPTPSEVVAAQKADSALCTSSSTAVALVNALGLAGLPPTIISIGPKTTETLEQLHVHVAATAEPHTLDGLFETLRTLTSFES